MVSHTATGEWQSFEGRMRRRRAERLALRADVAADAGCVEEARQALAEARMLVPNLADLDRIQNKLDSPVELPAEAGSHETSDWQSVTLAAEDGSPEDSSSHVASSFRRRSTAAAAAVVALLAGGAAAMIYGGHREPPLQPTQEFREAVPEVAPPGGRLDSTTPPPIAEPQPISTTGSIDAPAEATPRAETTTSPAASVVPASFTTPAPAPAPEPALPSAPEAGPLNPGTLPETTVAPLPPLERVAARETTEAPRPPSIATDTLAVTPGVAAAAPEPIVSQDALVRSALDRYASAYSTLDADAAQRAWPGVNRDALSRAFDGLASQRVSLGSCSIDVSGGTAHARCAGTTMWQPKVGGGMKIDRHTWTFDLAKAGSGWQIVNARVQNR